MLLFNFADRWKAGKGIDSDEIVNFLVGSMSDLFFADLDDGIADPVAAVLVRCRPRAPSMCTDFFAARPASMNHTAWGRSRKKNGRVNNELSAYNVFRSAIEGGRATVWNVERAYRAGRGRGCRELRARFAHRHGVVEGLK